MRRIVVTLTLGLIVVGLRSISVTHAQSDQPIPINIPLSRALAFVKAADENLDYVPGEVLVKFKTGVTIDGQDRALQALRSRPVTDQLRWIGDAALFTDPNESDATVLAAQLAAQPEVEYAEPNYLYHKLTTPNDPGFATNQWNLKAIDLPKAWDINPGANSNLTVAIVDFGITSVTQTFTLPTWNGRAIQNVSVPFRVNPDLVASRLVAPHDFVSGGGSMTLDMEGHGTHVSSTIGEDTNNELAEAGIAYNVRIMPVKVCAGFWEVQFALSTAGFRGFAPLNAGVCTDDAIAQGIRYAADNGAKVINVSIGGPSAPPITILEALHYAVAKGSFVALAAGNSYDQGNPVIYPAAFAPSIDGVMAVGAVAPSLGHAYYSSAGPYVEIAAPGGDELEMGERGAIWQSTISQTDADPASILFPRFDRYFETPLQGTSMASPHVAGIAALIMSQGVTNPAAVEALIKGTARDLGAPGRDDLYGYGLVQPRAALLGNGVTR
jgi:serine protease